MYLQNFYSKWDAHYNITPHIHTHKLITPKKKTYAQTNHTQKKKEAHAQTNRTQTNVPKKKHTHKQTKKKKGTRANKPRTNKCKKKRKEKKAHAHSEVGTHMAVVTITSLVPEAPVDDNVLDEALGEAEGVQEVLAETQLRTPHKAPLAGVVAAQRVLFLQLLVQMHQGCSQVACDSSRRRGSMCIARKDEK